MILRGLPRSAGSNTGSSLLEPGGNKGSVSQWGFCVLSSEDRQFYPVALVSAGRTFKLFINSQVICKIWLAIVLDELLA